jgi:hypothetical protein
MTRQEMQPAAPDTLAKLLPQHLFVHRTLFLALLVVMFALSACGANTGGNTSPTATTAQATTTIQATAQPTPATTPQATATETTVAGYLIKVYFSKFPDSLQEYTAVYAVNRVSPTLAIATFSIQLLIAGPTLEERNAGYFSELNSILTGPSTCNGANPTGGPDFILTLDKKGSATEAGTATMQFCRTTQSPGIGADARIQAEIRATLSQFSNIKKVVVLTTAGHCFGDASGADACLK